MSPQEKVLWAIRFTEMDLTALRPGDDLNLQDDSVQFLDWPKGAYEEWNTDLGWQTITPKSQIHLFALQETQDAARKILASLADWNATVTAHPGVRNDIIAEYAVTSVRKFV